MVQKKKDTPSPGKTKTKGKTKAVKRPRVKAEAAKDKKTGAKKTKASPKSRVLKKETPKAKAKTLSQYWEGVGRRKTAVARVRISMLGEKAFLVNGQKPQDYFSSIYLGQLIRVPLEELKLTSRFRVSVNVRGGGVSSQAIAVRHGLSRALVKFNANLRKKLKEPGFLTRDPRMKERKKFGLKRARRAPQWQKR